MEEFFEKFCSGWSFSRTVSCPGEVFLMQEANDLLGSRVKDRESAARRLLEKEGITLKPNYDSIRGEHFLIVIKDCFLERARTVLSGESAPIHEWIPRTKE